jgi:hypothetical protein
MQITWQMDSQLASMVNKQTEWQMCSPNVRLAASIADVQLEWQT